MGEEGVGTPRRIGQSGEAGRQPDRRQVAPHPCAVALGTQSEANRQVEREAYADGHRFAVQQRLAEAALGLQRVTEGVSQVEERPAAAFLFVVGDDGGLGGATGVHRAPPRLPVAGAESGPGIFQPGEERGVADQPVLQGLGVAGQELAWQQGVEGGDVGENQVGLIEGAQQILAEVGIDAGLAADRTVHLGEQGGRDLDQGKAAKHDAGGEPGDVADDAAAKRDDRGVAFDAKRQQAIGELAQVLQVLGPFAGGQDDCGVFDGGLAEGCLQGCQIEWRHVGVGDDDDAGLAQLRAQVASRLGHQPFADDDVVAASAEVHPERGDAGHAPPMGTAAASNTRFTVSGR